MASGKASRFFLQTAGTAFAAIVLVLSAAGYVYYRREAAELRDGQLHLLAAVGRLKADQVHGWRNERLGDAKRVAESPFLQRAIAEFLRDPQSRARRDDLRELLTLEEEGTEYADVLLLIPDGRTILLSATQAANALNPATQRAAVAALGTHDAALSDFYRAADGVVDVDAAAAVRDPAGHPYAVAVLRSNAEAVLYPLIQSWPTPSPSAETLLLGRDGDSVVYLNELRHRLHSALRLRVPLSSVHMPAVQAVLGKRGVFDGVDYRGIEVLADMRAIPDSPWFLIAKIDRTEALAEVRYRRGEVITIIGLFTLLAAGALAYRRRKAVLFESLAESERGLREAQAVGRVGSYVLDIVAGKWTSSVVLDAIFGIDAAFPRTTAGWGRLVHPAERDEMLSYQGTIVADHRRFDREYRIVRASDGAERWVWGLGEVVYDANGTPLRMFGAIQDITERKLGEEKIRRLNAELEERVQQRTAQLHAANKELEAFAYSVSHDLRAPLRAVDGYARVLEEEQHARIDDEGRRVLAVVRSEARRMGRLIDDLLAFSRLGRREVERRETDMTLLAREVFQELHRDTAGRNVELKLAELPPAMCDPGLMHQVWTNLLGNAVKFSRGRDRATIEITGSVQGNEIVYVVKDNGVGFDMQYADKLFGVFQRLHSADEFEGTGVGLALVQRIVARHDGRVWAEAVLNRGASFFFSLPLGTAGIA